MNSTVQLLIIVAFVNAAFFVRTLFILTVTPRLKRRTDAPNSHENPALVSVLVPARNEASRVVRENLLSLARQTYPALEVVVIDDRSTDSTLAILQDVQNTFPDRIYVVQGEPLPPGWLGKTFALQQGKERSRGEWLLLADADGIFDATAVASAMEFSRAHNLDALSLMPKVILESFWENLVLPVICWLTFMRISPTQANRPSSPYCCGNGSFILIRRTAHDAIGGFRRYRSHVVDDCAVMEVLKSAGYSAMLCGGAELLQTRMYSTLPEIVNGFAKNSFAVLNNSLLRLSGVIAWQMATVFFPLYVVGLGLLSHDFHTVPYAVIAILPMCLTMAAIGIEARATLSFFVLYPLGDLMSLFILLRSAYAHVGKRPVEWKGRVMGREN